jgi:hypothetical protein
MYCPAAYMNRTEQPGTAGLTKAVTVAATVITAAVAGSWPRATQYVVTAKAPTVEGSNFCSYLCKKPQHSKAHIHVKHDSSTQNH